MPKPPFSPLGIDHLVLSVNNLSRMADFYCQVLGCSLEKKQDNIGLWQLRCGKALIDLQLADANGHPEAHRNLDHFCIVIDHYDEQRLTAWLATNRVTVGEAGNRYGAEGSGPSLYIEDPEGNRVELKASLTPV